MKETEKSLCNGKIETVSSCRSSKMDMSRSSSDYLRLTKCVAGRREWLGNARAGHEAVCQDPEIEIS